MEAALIREPLRIRGRCFLDIAHLVSPLPVLLEKVVLALDLLLIIVVRALTRSQPRGALLSNAAPPCLCVFVPVGDELFGQTTAALAFHICESGGSTAACT